MVLITADGKVGITVNKDTLSTSEGLGTVPREVTGRRKRAVASMELPQNGDVASVLYIVSIVSKSIC